MDVKRLREVHSRLMDLTQNQGSPEAIQAQLAELEKAIDELEARPQTRLPEGLLRIPEGWQAWPETLGYDEPPFVRSDSMIVCKVGGNTHYFAKHGNGQFVTDKRNRKRFWKYPITAMVYLNRDYPIQES